MPKIDKIWPYENMESINLPALLSLSWLAIIPDDIFHIIYLTVDKS